MENSKNMSQEKFNIKFFTDIKEFYNVTISPGGTYQFSSLTSNAMIHIDMCPNYIYEQYKAFKDYTKFKTDFIETVNSAIRMYQFNVDMRYIIPLVKPRSFTCKDIEFIRDEVENTELDILYVQDTASLYKFISASDLEKDKIVEDEFKKRAWKNLSSIIIPLRRLDERLEVYNISDFDNAATLVFTQLMQKQIEPKLRTKDWIFSIPSSSNLLVAKYSHYNLGLLDYIKDADTDYNKISTDIFRVKNGLISTLAKRKQSQKQKFSVIK